MRHLESQIQKQCVTWFRLQYADIALLLFAVPNGGARNRLEAAIMNGEGVTAGVADLLLLHANSEHHGLCIEMKTPKGKQTDSQKRFQRKVEAFGYRYEVIHSLDEFMILIRDYLSKVVKS